MYSAAGGEHAKKYRSVLHPHLLGGLVTTTGGLNPGLGLGAGLEVDSNITSESTSTPEHSVLQ